MAGSEVMKFAVKIMAEAADKVVADAGLTWDDIDLIIPHQALFQFNFTKDLRRVY